MITPEAPDRSYSTRLRTALLLTGSGTAGAYHAGVLRDVLESFTGRFASLFVIRAAHNPLTPLDFAGVYDERSDRRQTLGELVDRGYEDAYRQFVEPIVGAGAEPAEPVHQGNDGQGAPSRL